MRIGLVNSSILIITIPGIIVAFNINNMPHVKFTSHLQRYFPSLTPMEVEGSTVAEIVSALDAEFPGFSAYIVDQQGALRQHVHIFIGEEMIKDRAQLGDTVGEDEQIYFMQALSGG